MSKYEKPEINIVEFNTENIIAASSILNGMVDDADTQVKVISYNDILEPVR